MTLTGQLTDYEGDIARVNDKPLKMLPAAAKWCNDRLKKGMTIDYDLVEDGDKKGYIAKLWERKAPVTDIAGDAVDQAKAKMAANGFGQPTPGTAKQEEKTTTSTSTLGTPATKPAGDFWNVLGVVESIDIPARKATVLDEQGILHPITWAAGYLDEKFAKLKPGYYRKFSGEVSKPDVVTAVGWMGKDEPEWVKARNKALHPSGFGGGWKGGAPKNDRVIVLQCCMKVAADVWMHTHMKVDDLNFGKAMPEITAEAIKAAGELCKAGGVQ